MTDHLPPTGYISRVVPLPAGIARPVFTSTPACRMTRLRRGLRSRNITIELTPWSSTRSELSIRFGGRRLPSLRDCEVAGELIDSLAADLELRCLLALHPTHTTGRPARREPGLPAWL